MTGVGGWVHKSSADAHKTKARGTVSPERRRMIGGGRAKRFSLPGGALYIQTVSTVGFKTTTRYTMCINDTPLYKLELNNISEHHIHVKHFLVRVCLGQGPDTIPSTQIYTTVMYLLGAARSFLSVSNTYAHTNTHTLLSGGSAEGGLCGVQLSAWHQCYPQPPLPPPPRLLRSSRKLVT